MKKVHNSVKVRQITYKIFDAAMVAIKALRQNNRLDPALGEEFKKNRIDLLRIGIRL